MVQSASIRMAGSLVPVFSGRAGGAAGSERAKTNARQRETLQVQRHAESPYRTMYTAEICCAAKVVGEWDERLEPPSQSGNASPNLVGATSKNPLYLSQGILRVRMSTGSVLIAATCLCGTPCLSLFTPDDTVDPYTPIATKVGIPVVIET